LCADVPPTVVKTRAILILVVLAALAVPAVADEVDDLIFRLNYEPFYDMNYAQNMLC
jgi:hypothetical protein